MPLVNAGYLILLSDEIVFRHEDYQKIIAKIRTMFETQDTISVAQVRDAFQTSRRYVLSILEHLDADWDNCASW